MSIQNNKTKAITFMTMLTIIMIVSTITPASATVLGTCIVGSSPTGIIVSGSDVWSADAAGDIDYSDTTCSSTNTYTASGTPHNLAVVSGGNLVYTDHSTAGCLYKFSTSSHTSTSGPCVSGLEGEDVSQDASTSTAVWAGLYGTTSGSKIEKWDTSSGTSSTVALPFGCQEPEGLRVDSSDNIWVFSQSCEYLLKYTPSSSTWTGCSFGGSDAGWYIALDNTNSEVWISDNTNTRIYEVPMSAVTTTPGACNESSFTPPSGDSGPLGIALDNNIVPVSFQSSGTADVYNWSTATWNCAGLDSLGSTSSPYGMSFASGGDYWTALQGSGEHGYGAC
jgi:streptogramin lyase